MIPWWFLQDFCNTRKKTKLLEGFLPFSIIWIVAFTLMRPQEALDSIGLLNTGIACLYLAPKALFEVYMPELHIIPLNCNQFGAADYCRCCGVLILSQYSEQKMRSRGM